MPNREELEVAVQRGATALDEEYNGADWAIGLDLEKLNMADCRLCVLGQLGDYASMIYELGLVTLKEEIAYGFEVNDIEERPYLYALWVDAVHARRA